MENAPGGLHVGLLGPVEISVAGQPAPLTQPGLRALLATLALSANRRVPASTLIAALWQEEPTRTRERNLHAQAYQLRKRLAALEPDRDSRLVSRHPGYLLTLGPGELDVAQFAASAERGRVAAPADPDAAAGLLGQALALWRGPALADVAGLSDLLAAEATALEEQRLAVHAAYADACLAAGRHAQLVGELVALVAQHPLRERQRGQLMLALYRAGRQAEALACFQEGRRVLRAELGVEPGPELRDLHLRILRADTQFVAPVRPLAGGDPAGAGPAPRPAGPLIPRQLPAGTRQFTGRAAELGMLDGLLTETAPDGAVILTVISGPAGIGKTTLALHWAHKVARHFPDGQLCIDLRGDDPDGTPVTAARAAREFLAALGIPVSEVPESPDAQTALYRTALADRRVLVLLDNATDAAQVRPLLPASAGCLVIVTSRTTLTGLVTTEGAVPVPLGRLPVLPESVIPEAR